MKKRICRALVIWIPVLAVTGTVALWTGSRILMTAGILWLLIPFVSTIQNLYLRKKIQVTVSLPAVAAKREMVTGTVTVQNNSHLSYTNLFCEIAVENRLTKEQEIVNLEFNGASVGQSERSFEVSSDYCGYLQVYPARVWLMDWIGFIPVRCKLDRQKAETAGERNGEAVLPDTFRPHIFMSLAQTAQEDADNWSQTQKGNDLSEIFALRDYVPGDSLKQIHWKLSSKRGELIVREPSLPVEKSLLFFWDKNTEQALPVEMDAMAECAASVSQGILNLGYSFTLGWTEGCKLVFENIENEEELLQAIPRMVKHGAERTGSSEEYLNELTEAAGHFGKMIYLAKTLDENMRQFPCADIICLLCGQEASMDDYRVISFRAEHYQEDLAAIEL